MSRYQDPKTEVKARVIAETASLIQPECPRCGWRNVREMRPNYTMGSFTRAAGIWCKCCGLGRKLVSLVTTVGWQWDAFPGEPYPEATRQVLRELMEE